MYKKFLLLFLLFFCTSLTPKVFSQVPTTIRTVASLPATCHGGNSALPSDEVMLVTGGVGYQYVCGSSNTWVQNSTALLLSNNNTWTGNQTWNGTSNSIAELTVTGNFTVDGTCTGCGGGSGLPGTIVYVTPGSSQSAIQAILTAATAGDEIWFTGTYTACGLTLSTSYVRLRGLDTEGSVIQCATASSPVLTVSGGNGDEVSGITFEHITNTPTCPGGNGTSTCGDGLQIAGGTYGTKVSNVQADSNYNGFTLGYTSYGEFSNSRDEYNQNHGVAFIMDATHKVMQWQVSRVLSQQNLGNGFDMTCPASFSSVQTSSPYITGWTQAYGNVGNGFHFSCSAATSSGIADLWINGAFASQNNASGFYFDLGPNGGRNLIVNSFYSEQSGTYTGAAGFAKTSQSATNVGYGIEITSSCDNTPAPVLTGGVLWQNSYSGAISSCSGTSFSNVDGFDNGFASASAQTEALLTVNASAVSINSWWAKKGTTQTYGIYIESGDIPSVVGKPCDSSISTANCVYTASAPTSGFQQQIGSTVYVTGSGAPTMNCQPGWAYYNSTATSAVNVEYRCTAANTWVSSASFSVLTSLSANTPTALCALCMGQTDVILAGCSGCNTSLTRNGQSSLNIATGQGTSGPLLVGDYEGVSAGYGPAGSQSIWSNQSANSDLDGELTMSSGTATYTFSTSNTYTVHPICTANDNTAIAAVQVTYTGTTSVTFHTSGSSDVVEYHCHGRN
jgi:hypothetical protein